MVMKWDMYCTNWGSNGFRPDLWLFMVCSVQGLWWCLHACWQCFNGIQWEMRHFTPIWNIFESTRRCLLSCVCWRVHGVTYISTINRNTHNICMMVCIWFDKKKLYVYTHMYRYMHICDRYALDATYIYIYIFTYMNMILRPRIYIYMKKYIHTIYIHVYE